MSDISGIKAVDISAIKIRPPRSELATKMMSLEIGQGFEVKNSGREEFSWLITKAKADGRAVGTKKLGKLHYLIYRYA